MVVGIAPGAPEKNVDSFGRESGIINDKKF